MDDIAKKPNKRDGAPNPSAKAAEDETDSDPSIQSLSDTEEREARERAGPRATVVYASISARGIEELARPAVSLWGSGVSAGLIITISIIAEALLLHAMPAFEGRKAVADIGYTLGFLIVIMGRLQLFTENTITPVLPLLADPSKRRLWRTVRLWVIVFAANTVGTFIAAGMLVGGDIVRPDQLDAIIAVAQVVTGHTPFETLRYGVVAGFLIAALVWCLPTARGSEFFLIFFITYIIALGEFVHVVAGSGEAFLLLFAGHVSVGFVFLEFLLPAFVGNVLGGTLLFAGLAYVQVMDEIHEEKHGRRGSVKAALHAPLLKREKPSN